MKILRKIIKKTRKRAADLTAIIGATIGTAAYGTIPVYAEDVSSVVAPIGKVLDLFEYIIIAIGAIILLKNLVETVQAYQQQDSSGMHSGLKGIAAGAVMVGAATVMRVLGIGH